MNQNPTYYLNFQIANFTEYFFIGVQVVFLPSSMCSCPKGINKVSLDEQWGREGIKKHLPFP